MKKAISIIGPLLILFLGSYLSFTHWSLSILAQELEKEITPKCNANPQTDSYANKGYFLWKPACGPG